MRCGWRVATVSLLHESRRPIVGVVCGHFPVTIAPTSADLPAPGVQPQAAVAVAVRGRLSFVAP